MPEEIVARILRLPGYGVYAWDADEAANTLTLSIRPTGRAPAYICGGCGISRQEIHSWTERRVRDLPWGTWQVWLGWRSIACGVASAGCGPSGCRSWAAKPTTRRGWRPRWPRAVKRPP